MSKLGQKPRMAEERFWEKVDIRPGECWLWTAGVSDTGYGKFSGHNSRQMGSHVFAYEQYNGKVPKGLQVRHKCDVKLCCRPDHLEVGSHQDNMEDMTSRDRQAKGEANGFSKLSAPQVLAIRDDTRSQREIAADYGVCQSQVSNIKSGKVWTHVTDEVS